MEALIGKLARDKHQNKPDRIDTGQDEPEVLDAVTVSDGGQFVRGERLGPHVQRPNAKGHDSSDKVNFEDGRLLKVGHQAQAERGHPAEPQGGLVEPDGFVVDVVA